MDLSAFSLAGKRILVTGANTGIGQGIAVSLARAGAELVLSGRSSMAETAGMIAELGGHSAQLEVDLAQPGAGAQLIERAWTQIGPLDGLVNNAGIIRRADALEFSEEDWDDVIDLNLKQAFFAAQRIARFWTEAGRGGKIVNIASVLSFQGGIRVASYTASKSGLAGLTRLLACEWAGKGICVNAIAPGYIETNNTQALRDDPARHDAILARIPAGRWGQPSDIGDAAAFLCAKASDYLHGAVLPVDGGWLCR